jgi:CDP-glycerol glycerophosphotransferase (TagB/SpsB family)
MLDPSASSVLFDEKFTAVELGMLAEACISDYSSLIYEFMIMEKPVYFFTFDLDEYEQARGIFIDYHKEVPGGIYKNSKNLVKAIANNTHSAHDQQAFLAKYVTYNNEKNTEALSQKLLSVLKADLSMLQ